MSVRPFLAVGVTTVALVALLRFEEAAPPAATVSRPLAVAPSTTGAPKAAAAPTGSLTATVKLPTPSPRSTAPARAAVPASPAASHAQTRAPARPLSMTAATPPPRTQGAPPPTHAAPAPSPAATTATYTGQTAQTPYGPVQVKIWVTGRRVTDVQSLQMPNDTPRSQQISSDAGPQLRQEALQAQSANIDTVSGATYTSDGYRQSLQAALDQAHLP